MKRYAAITAAATVLVLSVADEASAIEDSLFVEMNRAKVIRLDQPAATVILGNPAIADALVQNRTMLVITGKSYGSTNLIVLDPAGETVEELTLNVTAVNDGSVTMQKGTTRLSFSCTPVCERTLAVGDSKDPFSELDSQIQSSLGLAQGQAGLR
ncbi:putative type II/III system pilus formation protein [Tepidamorphus gemmatus]|uniref:Putative type II/III system pilus formation protein n=1 Tax=Tepidamorphus gemmatus TaxID=747076 RepID=A0A4R3M291_9HYPH|nr:pilus assembly protein N-terminal domain-containing protein [Tepidamorphus gemmatus]TCT07230.1 putative type II/III system pilus formation protein [Tepidamorphus gemmatus]